jgi:hypothetical protein
MPTPFMHMVAAQRLIEDPEFPEPQSAFIQHHWGAFLLGSISPDAHHRGKLSREDSHFFAYRAKVDPPAVQSMLKAHPALKNGAVSNLEQRAFVAGYLSHLEMDEVWCEDMLYPEFYGGEWESRGTAFFMLHVLLSWMDARDYLHLHQTHHDALLSATADHWLEFFPDEAINAWRDAIASQIQPIGTSQTVEILGKRVSQGVEGVREILQSPERLEREMWVYITPAKMAAVEEKMYARMRQTVADYLR